MKKEALIFLLLLCGACGSYRDLVPTVTMECFSNGLVVFNQDGIYYIPKDSCCFLQESDEDIDGLILVDRISSNAIRCYERSDMEKIKAVEFYCKHTPNVGRRTIPGVNDNTYFVKMDSCYMVFAQIHMYSYGESSELDKRFERTYPWDVSIAGQDIRVNILDGRHVFFEIESTEPVDSVQLADFFDKKHDKYEFGHDAISFLYVNNTNSNEYKRITFSPTGNFTYSEDSHILLGELCHYNKGRWYQKEDTLILTTFIQNKVEDYIVDMGDFAYEDSILITIYSLQTGETTDDFAYIDGKDSFIQPTSEGRLCIPCQERVNFTRQLMLGVTEEENENIELQCGRKYKCYLKDCYPIMMQGKKFVVKDSTLIDIGTGELYIKER